MTTAWPTSSWPYAKHPGASSIASPRGLMWNQFSSDGRPRAGQTRSNRVPEIPGFNALAGLMDRAQTAPPGRNEPALESQCSPADDSEVCPACHGAGFLRRDRPLGAPDFGLALICKDCTPPPPVATGIPVGLQEATFESFDVGLNPSMRSALDQVSRVASGEDWCAVLNGPPGIGKTHLAVAALHASVHPRPGLFFTHIGLLTWIRKRSFGEDARDTEDDVLMFFQTNPALVVLDDLDRKSTRLNSSH